jgi:Tfp pilus assembly major pilin PilA
MTHTKKRGIIIPGVKGASVEDKLEKKKMIARAMAVARAKVAQFHCINDDLEERVNATVKSLSEELASKSELKVAVADLISKIEQSKTETLKWTIATVLTACGIGIAGLAIAANIIINALK